MDNQKREKYESPAVEVLTVAVEYGFAGSGGEMPIRHYQGGGMRMAIGNNPL